MIIRFVYLLLFLSLAGCTLPTAPVSTPTLAPSPTPRPGLFVDAGYDGGVINPLVYGSNTGPWQTVGLEQPVQSRDAGISLIRWPGGNWGDENSVSHLQVDEFMALVRTIGAEPMIHVRLYEGTPEEAAELVRYVSIEKQYGVRYWAVGNEPDLFIALAGGTVSGPAEIWGFADGIPVEQSGTADLSAPITFAPRSVTLLAVPMAE